MCLVNDFSGIYKIENIINHKIYVGQSSHIKERWAHHCSDLNSGCHHNCHLQNAWNKYGRDSFKFSVIEECAIDELDNREQYWIEYYDSYNTGYNLDKGGQGIRGYKHTQEELDKMHRIQKPLVVLQFDTSFNFVKRWIGRYNNVAKKIPHCCKESILLRIEHCCKEMTPYKNSYWVYEREYKSSDFSWDGYLKNKNIKIYRGDKCSNTKRKKIKQYSLQGNYIKTWDNYDELANEGYNIVYIQRICTHTGNMRVSNNSIWCFDNGTINDGYFKNVLQTTS